jgi:5'-3' exonuclease
MKILAIDFDSMFRRNWEAEAGQDSGNAFRRTVEEIARRRDGWARVVLAADSGTSFRKARVTDYKEGRTNPGAAYYEQRRRCLARLAADACVVIEGPAVDGGHAEADDVLGWLAAAYAKHTRTLADDVLANWWLRILSGDGDLEQLVSDNDGIDLLKPTEREAWNEAAVQRARGVTPDKIPHLKALSGDKSDNFPGFEGIGSKTAAALIAKYGDAVKAVTDGADDASIRMTAPQRAALKSGGPELAAKGVFLATLKIDLPLDFTALILPEPKVGTIAGDEPLGGFVGIVTVAG